MSLVHSSSRKNTYKKLTPTRQSAFKKTITFNSFLVHFKISEDFPKQNKLK